MIYTLTFNPAIDYITETDALVFGGTNRSKSEQVFFGGKGINVSCVLNELKTETTALGFIAGFTGKALEEHMKSKGIKTDFVTLKKGLTRINVKLKNDEITEINAAGPEIESDELEKLYIKLDKIKSGDTLVLSGSIPKTVPQNIYQNIMERLSYKNIRFVVDAEGELLLNSLKYKPFLIKPNLDELSMIFERKIKEESEIISAATELQKNGALNVLVTMGADGAILLGEDGRIIKRSAHKIKAVNTVGAGDSMVAGFISGIEKGSEYALELGTAAAAATTMDMGLATSENIAKFIDI